MPRRSKKPSSSQHHPSRRAKADNMSARGTRLGLELLERREMLAADNTLAIFEGTIATEGIAAQQQVVLATSGFTLAGDFTVLGFRTVSTSGDFNPTAVTIRDAANQVVASVSTANDLPGLADGLSLVALPLGTFTVDVSGQGTGNFRLEVFLAGDADGDGSIDNDDANLIRTGFGAQTGNPVYRAEADANLDGRITSFDLFQWQTNRGDASSIVPLTLSASFAAGSVVPDGDSFLTNQLTVGVTGAAVAGANVTVNTDGDGQFDDGQVIAGANGSFMISNLALGEGPNSIAIRAADSLGQQRTSVLQVTRDSAIPLIQIDGLLASNESAPSLLVTFSESMQGAVLDASHYVITRSGEPVGNRPIVVSSAVPVDDLNVRLQLSAPLAEGATYELTLPPGLSDRAGNLPAANKVSFTVPATLLITELSPANGEVEVSLVRETIVRFSREIDPGTVSLESLHIFANGERVPGRVVVSSTNRFATFFYDAPLPPSTAIRVTVDGEKIKDRRGNKLDADGDGSPGGVRTAEFRTLPLTRITGTNVFGYVYDSYNKNLDGTDRPVVNARIRIDAFPELEFYTDASGRFELTDMPAPTFFVHIDGSTAINAPAGTVYPSVGKPFHSVPGETTQLNMQGVPFNVYLPPMGMGDVVNLSPNSSTDVGFGAAAKAQLQQMFPDVDPAVWERVHVTYPAGSARNDQGNPASQAIIIPVPPDRLPAPLPPGVDPKLVISVQAPGASNFDVPAPVSFPNLDGLPPGAQTLLWSFNHDAGRWEVSGIATVSADGLSVTSNSGVGIRAPGWHFLFPGVFGNGCIGPDCDCPPDNCDCKTVEFAAGVLSQGEFSPIGITVDVLVAGLPGLGTVRVPKIEPKISFELEPRLTELSFKVSECIADYIRSLLFSVSAGVKAEITGSIGLTTSVGWTGKAGESSITFKDNVSPINVSLGVKFKFTDFFFCDIPLGVGAYLCQEHAIEVSFSKAVNLFTGLGVPKTIQLSEPLTADFDDTATLTLANADFSLANTTLNANVFFREKAQSPQRISAPLASNAVSLFPESRPYYRYVFANGQELAGRASPDGTFNVVLPPNEAYVLYGYSPATNQGSVYVGQTHGIGEQSFSPVILDSVGGEDADGDQIPDIGEKAIGTSPESQDTDGDGILDLAELAQGLDPLGGRAFPTGIVSSLQLLGPSKEVVIAGDLLNATAQTAYVATGSHGLAIVDASQFNNPIILGQLDLPGDAVDVAVDAGRNIAVVAAKSGGLHFVDVSDPVVPHLVRTVQVSASQVEVLDGVVYAATESGLFGFNVTTGEPVESVGSSGGSITGMARDGRRLYTMDAARLLRVFELTDFGIQPRGSLTLPQGGGKLISGNGVVYAGAQASYSLGGYVTVDVSDPDDLTLISGSDLIDPFIAPGLAITPNGSGLALAAGFTGRTASTPSLGIVDASNLATTNAYVSQFSLPAAPYNVTTASGIGYVADGHGGLIVVNYVPFDNRRVAPVVSIATTAVDLLSDVDGFQVTQGTSIPIQVDVTDDVQVRNVELIVNGRVVRNDVTFPFDFDAIALDADVEGVTTVVARVTDTGGNVATSEPLVLELVADEFAPTVVLLTPEDGSTQGRNVRRITIGFSEPMDRASLSPESFVLTNDLGTIQPLDVLYRFDDRLVELVYPKLQFGEHGYYRFAINASQVTDRAGNALGLTEVVSEFTVVEGTAYWINPAGGEWTNPANWDRGVVPGPNDDVVIRFTGVETIPEIRLQSSTQIRSLLNEGNLRLISNVSSNTRLTVTEELENHGVIRLDSTRNDRTTTLASGGLITNAQDGLIEIIVGGGGGRSISSAVTNLGAIRVASGIGLGVTNTGRVFTQAGGTLEGYIELYNGRFNFTGGTIPGSFNTFNAENFVADTVTGTSEFRVFGTSSRLEDNLSPTTTIRLMTNVDHNTTLTTADGAVNVGTILLDSSRNDRTSRINTGDAFTNAPTGLIRSVNGAGGNRVLAGTFVNQGQLKAEGYFLTVNGTYEAAGGDADSAVNLWDTQLRITASPASSTTLRLFGDGQTLLTDNLANTVLHVFSEVTANAKLTVPNAFTNHGVIRLDSTRNDRTTTLASGGLITNAQDGLIEIIVGGGGGRRITGGVTNQGSIALMRQSLTIAGAFANEFGGTVGGIGALTPTSLTDAGTIDLAGESVVSRSFASGEIRISLFGATDLNESQAENIANYRLVFAGDGGDFGDGNDIDLTSTLISSVTYDNAADSIVVRLAAPQQAGRYSLEIDGDGVADASGVPLLSGRNVIVTGFLGSSQGSVVSVAGSAGPAASPSSNGDYHRNGYVDGADFLLWQRGFASTTNLAADGNRDGVVDAADYVVWRDNFGATSASQAVVAASSAFLAPLIAAAATIAEEASNDLNDSPPASQTAVGSLKASLMPSLGSLSQSRLSPARRSQFVDAALASSAPSADLTFDYIGRAAEKRLAVTAAEAIADLSISSRRDAAAFEEAFASLSADSALDAVPTKVQTLSVRGRQRFVGGVRR